VVRAVAASEIPVVSAVGHEIDWALSDFAADLRAPTPSAAAELVSEGRFEIRETIQYLGEELLSIMQNRIERIRLLAKPFSLEDLEYRFRAILQPRLVRFDDAKEELLLGLQARLGELGHRLDLARRTLEAGSPLAALERGFSVVMTIDGVGGGNSGGNSAGKTGRVVRRAGDVKPGDHLIIRPLEGTIEAEVRGA
jgi:exodeoxyribonuclease VII large subunit